MAGNLHPIDGVLLVGSGNNNLESTPGKDFDFIGTPGAINKLFKSHLIQSRFGKIVARYPVSSNRLVQKHEDGTILEAEFAYLGTSGYDLVARYGSKIECDWSPAPDIVKWMLKESHKYKDSVHFEKTRSDVLAYRKSAVVDSVARMEKFFESVDLLDILKKREQETYRPHVKLNVTKDEFFADDGVDYMYDHDRIHEIMALGDKPAYLYIKEPGQDVRCSKDRWDSVVNEVKINCVIEEARVIALERGVIPFIQLDSCTIEQEEHLFKVALQKICTTLTSGWFREFAWTNYDTIIISHQLHRIRHGSYVQKFKQCL